MFHRVNRMQYHARPERPDPLYAKKLQELIGGQWGEMSVMTQYLFQGWNCRGPAKYRDMILDIGTEEIGHVEMLATMVCRLLEGASTEDQEATAKSGGVVSAILGGTSPKDMIAAAAMNPQHAIVGGLGAMPADSVGNRWSAHYITSSGNLLADFRLNVTAESQGRVQACRLYEMTTDPGVRDMLSFLIARDTMHQNQWLAAIEELELEGFDRTPVPNSFPQQQELQMVSYQYWSLSGDDGASSTGRWAAGPTPDGRGEFEYLNNPEPLGDEPELGAVDPRLHGTAKIPLPTNA
jgi:Mn-containing catalase